MQPIVALDGLRQGVERLSSWIRSDVLVPSTLAQAIIGCLLLGLVLVIANPLHRRVGGWAGRLQVTHVRQTAVALAPLAPWLVLLFLVWFTSLLFAASAYPIDLLRFVESVTLAWIVIRLASRLLRNPHTARMVAVIAWVLAVLNILHLIGPTAGLLSAMAITIGNFRLSVLLVLEGIIALVVLLWIANTLSRIAEHWLRQVPEIAPSVQVLAAKLAHVLLVTLAVVLALAAVGVDLTAVAVFSGAIGVGVGFGLQKVVSNLISGVILLMDRSIKPGDVIEIEGTYGWINKLNARYVSLSTRDGREFLIPNEDLIAQRVTNWSYSNNLIRLHVPVGISYDSDPHRARELLLEAASQVPRVLQEPRPACLLKVFDDSAITLELRFWIGDPSQGVSNVKSDVLFRIWDLFRECGIEIPFPQRDLRVRNPEALAQIVARCSGAEQRAG